MREEALAVIRRSARWFEAALADSYERLLHEVDVPQFLEARGSSHFPKLESWARGISRHGPRLPVR